MRKKGAVGLLKSLESMLKIHARSNQASVDADRDRSRTLLNKKQDSLEKPCFCGWDAVTGTGLLLNVLYGHQTGGVCVRFTANKGTL